MWLSPNEKFLFVSNNLSAEVTSLQFSENPLGLSYGDAAFQAAGAIGAAGENAALAVIVNRVLHLGTEAGGAGGGESDLDALDRLDGDDRLGEAPVQPAN